MKNHSFVLLMALSAACLGGQAVAAQKANIPIATVYPGETGSTPIGNGLSHMKGDGAPTLHAIPPVMDGPTYRYPMWRVRASPGDGHVVRLRGDEFILPPRSHGN